MDFDQALKCALLSRDAYLALSSEQRFSILPNLQPEMIEGKATDTQGFILRDQTESRDTLYIVFRGSDSRTDWGINFDFRQAAFQYFTQETVKQEILENDKQCYPYEKPSRSGAKIHQGFTNAYATVRNAIHQYITAHPNAHITVTGHSLGGAMATLCAVDLQYNFGETLASLAVYTYGCPRIGNRGFRESFNRRVPNSYRIIYGMDLVPAFPRPWQSYSHVDREYRIGSRVTLDFVRRRFQDHKIDNYIAGLEAQAKKNKAPISQEVMGAVKQAQIDS